ncbi:MAG TPA: permease, partial [Caulobacteraceae bacterium]
MVIMALLIGLTLLAVAFSGAVFVTGRARGELTPRPEAVALGFITNFFDTLGIGSFAPTTAWLKLRCIVPDSYIPAVLNVGHAIPTVVEALIFIKLVRVDPWLLVACIGASVVGAVVGAPIVVRLP